MIYQIDITRVEGDWFICSITAIEPTLPDPAHAYLEGTDTLELITWAYARLAEISRRWHQ